MLLLLPCLAIIRQAEAMIEAVVLTLYVLWPSPPVPTMSHWISLLVGNGWRLTDWLTRAYHTRPPA